MNRRPATLALALITLALTPGGHRPPRADNGPEVVAVKWEPRPLPPDRWPPGQAVRIHYDRKRGVFVMSNVSPHAVWFDGRVREGPATFFERQLPGGRWAETAGEGCGTNRGWRPLPQGGNIVLGPFPYRVGAGGLEGGSQEAWDFVERHGRLGGLPARAYIWVTSDLDCEVRPAYSEVVTLP